MCMIQWLCCQPSPVLTELTSIKWCCYFFYCQRAMFWFCQVWSQKIRHTISEGKLLIFFLTVIFVRSDCSQQRYSELQYAIYFFRLYLLKLLWSQGLSTAQLDQVSQAIIVSRLRYALPVWSGFLSADLINRIQALLKRLFKFGYSSHLLSFHDLITSCSEDLFDNARISNHCLHELLSSYVHCLEILFPV